MNQKSSLTKIEWSRIITLHCEGYTGRKMFEKLKDSKTAAHNVISNTGLMKFYATKSGRRPCKSLARDDYTMDV